MDEMPGGKARGKWSRILVAVGGVAMLVGALDPMEGSLVILPGSGLVALGTVLGRGDRRLVTYRVGVFLLIVVGVGALWGLSAVGGLGGESGRSPWWGALVLPYLAGWSMGIWGPGWPRWLPMLGIPVGLWYLAILAMVLRNPVPPGRDPGAAPAIVLAAIGVVTIAGCILRLWKDAADRHPATR